MTARFTDAGCHVIADIVKVRDTIEALDLPKNTKSSKKYKIAVDGSDATVEKEKTTINNIVRYYHDEVAHLVKRTRNALYSNRVSEMKHIQTEYKVEMYIPQEFSTNQNVVIVAERNDEDHTVPSVMKLIEKLTDERVDEMILETDVDDTQRSEVGVPVPRIADRIVEVVTAFHRSESQNESLHRSSTCQDRTHTQSGGEDRQRFSVSRSKLRTHRMH